MQRAANLLSAVRRLASANVRLRSSSKPAGHSVARIVELADRARNQQRWHDAIQFYQAAIDGGAQNDALFVQLGHALKEAGEFARAQTAYHVFLDAHPDDPDINLQLGHLHNRQGDVSGALHWYKLALERGPDNADIAHHLESARRAWLRRSVESKRRRAEELITKRNWHAARALLRELVVDDGEEDLIGVLANVTKECGVFAEALELYRRYRTFAESRSRELLSDVELQVGHLFQAMGDLRRALHHYRLSRQHEFETHGHILATAPSDRELRACIREIYPCFWVGGD
jgi:tetratricopeptide (TPR) repeat protein